MGQKKKDKIARQKAEGTFLTEKQKQDRARAMAQLEALKQQGVHIPTKAEIAPEKAAEPQKKKIVYVDKKKLAKKQQLQTESHEPSPAAEEVTTEPPSKESTPVEETKPVVEVAPPEEPKDAWDVESEEEEEEEEEKIEEKTIEVEVKVNAPKKQGKKDAEEQEESE